MLNTAGTKRRLMAVVASGALCACALTATVATTSAQADPGAAIGGWASTEAAISSTSPQQWELAANGSGVAAVYTTHDSGSNQGKVWLVTGTSDGSAVSWNSPSQVHAGVGTLQDPTVAISEDGTAVSVAWTMVFDFGSGPTRRVWANFYALDPADHSVSLSMGQPQLVSNGGDGSQPKITAPQYSATQDALMASVVWNDIPASGSDHVQFASLRLPSDGSHQLTTPNGSNQVVQSGVINVTASSSDSGGAATDPQVASPAAEPSIAAIAYILYSPDDGDAGEAQLTMLNSTWDSGAGTVSVAMGTPQFPLAQDHGSPTDPANSHHDRNIQLAISATANPDSGRYRLLAGWQSRSNPDDPVPAGTQVVRASSGDTDGINLAMSDDPDHGQFVAAQDSGSQSPVAIAMSATGTQYALAYQDDSDDLHSLTSAYVQPSGRGEFTVDNTIAHYDHALDAIDIALPTAFNSTVLASDGGAVTGFGGTLYPSKNLDDATQSSASWGKAVSLSDASATGSAVMAAGTGATPESVVALWPELTSGSGTFVYSTYGTLLDSYQYDDGNRGAKTYSVAGNINFVRIMAAGGSGNWGHDGTGAVAAGTYQVDPGSSLSINLGQRSNDGGGAAFNGGGASGGGDAHGGAGRTDVSKVPAGGGSPTMLIVAGGAGGMGGDGDVGIQGGSAATKSVQSDTTDLSGGRGQSGDDATGGSGASMTGGGSGGDGATAPDNGHGGDIAIPNDALAISGGTGQGGVGGQGSSRAGGGGGGGYHGGGGGAGSATGSGAGGGAGSSYLGDGARTFIYAAGLGNDGWAMVTPAPGAVRTNLPNAALNESYDYAVEAGDGIGDVVFSGTSTQAGLTFGTDGHITGSPTSAGTHSWTVTETDAAGVVNTQTFTINVPSPDVPQPPDSPQPGADPAKPDPPATTTTISVKTVKLSRRGKQYVITLRGKNTQPKRTIKVEQKRHKRWIAVAKSVKSPKHWKASWRIKKPKALTIRVTNGSTTTRPIRIIFTPSRHGAKAHLA